MAKFLTPGDTKKGIKSTHHTSIAIAVIIVISLIIFIVWIFTAHSSKRWPYEPYVRTTGPPGSTAVSARKIPGTDGTVSDPLGAAS